jgi:16S rRNA processing protein RimM
MRDPEAAGPPVPSPQPRVPSWDDMALVGRIARPHGLRGQVVINPETDFVEERFAEGATLWTRSAAGEEQLTVASMRVQNGRPVVGFEGMTRIDDVERLAGLELKVPEETLQPLEPGSYYQHHLVGCAVETVAGDVVGHVASVEGGAGATRLVMNGPRGEILIPLAIDICVEIDVVNKRIRIDPPEGLLELNERGSVKERGPAKAGPYEGRGRLQAARK